MGQVTEALGVSAGTATRVIDNLVRRGLAERIGNPGDRRRVCVRPTRRGQKTIKSLGECYMRFWKTTFQGIPRSKTSETLAALELLVGALERAKDVCCGSPGARGRQVKKGDRA